MVNVLIKEELIVGCIYKIDTHTHMYMYYEGCLQQKKPMVNVTINKL